MNSMLLDQYANHSKDPALDVIPLGMEPLFDAADYHAPLTSMQLLESHEDSIRHAKMLIKENYYHQACDYLEILRRSKGDDPATAAKRALLQVKCYMALSNIKSARDVWEEYCEILEEDPSISSSANMLLGARLAWSQGDIKAALAYAYDALQRADNFKDIIEAKSDYYRIKYFHDGDALSAFEEIMPLWSTLDIDKSLSSQSSKLKRKLSLTLATAAIAQGKMHLAKDVIGVISQLDTVQDLELSLLRGIMLTVSGERELALMAAQDADTAALRDASSRQERAMVFWRQCWIYHCAGADRQAQRKAEEFLDLASACSKGGFMPYAEILLASCLIQRGSTQRASKLLERHFKGEELTCTDLNVSLITTLLLCKALLHYESYGLRRACSFLRNNKKRIFSPHALTTLCLLSHAHHNLLPLLCKAFGVEHLPTEFTDLLDSEDFQNHFIKAEKQLIHAESKKLKKRFVICKDSPEVVPCHKKPLEIMLFGGLELRSGGQPLDIRRWGNSKSRSILISLALNLGNDCQRELLMDRLWPGSSYQEVSNAFSVNWCQMRRRIANALPQRSGEYKDRVYESFQSGGGRCSLKADSTYVDVKEFEALHARLMDYLHDNDKAACLSMVKRMTDVYRGDILPGDSFHDWLNLEREQYRRQFLESILLAAGMCLAADEPESALFYLNRASVCDSASEELHYLSMKAYAAAGRREDAIASYHSCRHYLRDELGLDPSRRVRDLHQKLLCGAA
ncbi:MAG: bacterial transcriptional activator domain-containing protein [Coriobacteriia bacterium]|nr:bacterial transcriptional activator domain-containing protein [Coriobacteriia bacterium]MCL2537390.1 bacterial transcriptional activator domain-containing protein [Coriobacteriia bacterium]